MDWLLDLVFYIAFPASVGLMLFLMGVMGAFLGFPDKFTRKSVPRAEWLPLALVVFPLSLVMIPCGATFIGESLTAASTPYSDEVRETVEWSRPLASFDQAPGLDASVTGHVTSLLLTKRVDLEVDGHTTSEYVVMERRGDGDGLTQASYPADETVVYEDAEPGEARVELVTIRSGFKTVRHFGGDTEMMRDFAREYRIHVPEGAIDAGRLADNQEEVR